MSEENNGRPTLKTEAVVTLLERCFEDGSTVTEACHIAKISRKTYYEWVNTDEDFRNRMSRSQEYPDNIARVNLVEALKVKDIDVSKWWSERRRKKEFSLKQESNIQVPGGIKSIEFIMDDHDASKDAQDSV